MFEFDVFCIMIAAVLAAFSVQRFRKISLLLLINFIYFYVAAGIVGIHQSELPNNTLHSVYLALSGLTIVALVILGSYWPLFMLMFVYSLYNYCILLEYEFGGMGFHENFVAFARAQMCIELIVMLLMSAGCRHAWNRINPTYNYDNFVNSLFGCDTRRVGSERLV